MRLPNDDELYQVDQTYLGPPGRYIGRFRYRSLLIGPLLYFVGLALMVRLGIGIDLISAAVLFIIVRRATQEITGKLGGGVTVKSASRSIWHEITAHRAPADAARTDMPKLNRRRSKITSGYADRPGRRARWHMRSE